MSTPDCCSSEAPSRDQRLGPPVDTCWFIRWFQLHAFYQIIATICRKLTYRDYYNTVPQLHPEKLYDEFNSWRSRKPTWSIGQICFRMMIWEMVIAHVFAVIVGGLRMGCTQILVNLVYYVTNPHPTHANKMYAVKQLGGYILIFFVRVLVNEQSTRLINLVAIKMDTLLHLKVYDKLVRVSRTYLKHLTQADLLFLFRGETRLIYDAIRGSASLSSGLTTLILAQIFLYIRIGAIGMILLPVIILSLFLQILVNYRKAEINQEKLPFYHERLAMNIAFYDRFGDIRSMGWEEVMMRKNRQARRIQNQKHVTFFIYQNFYLFTVAFIPTLLMTFFLLAAEGSNQLNTTSPRRAYTVYTYIIMIQIPLRNFPYAVVSIFQAINAAKRLHNFFSAQQFEDNLDKNLEECSVRINNLVASIEDPKSISLLIKKYKISPDEEPPSLAHLLHEYSSKEYQTAISNNPEFRYHSLLFRDITINQNLEFKRGDRVMILTLDTMLNTEIMKALIGHLKTQEGSIRYNGKIGYINLEEFHFLRESIRNNILYKEKEDVGRLGKIYRDLDLDLDLDRLSKGADTVISDSNILLSIIQKKKISLARSLYNGADILLLDYFFEEMESDEVMELYSKYSQILKDKLLMITAKRVYFFKPEDKVIIMEHGRMIEYGVYADMLKNAYSRIHDFRGRSLTKMEKWNLLPKSHRITKIIQRPFFPLPHTDNHHDEAEENVCISGCPAPLKIIPHQSHQATATTSVQAQTQRIFLTPSPHDDRITPEYKSSNKSPYITWKHYSGFVKSSSVFLYLITFVLITISVGVRIFTDWWIGTYSYTSQAQSNATRYIGIYIGVNCVSAVLLLASGVISPFISYLGTENIMSRAMTKLFYVDVPIMRRISRLAISYLLSKDNEDFFYINQYIFAFWRSLLLFLGTFIILGLTTYVAWIVGGVLFVANLFMMYFFRKAFMELFDLGDPFRNDYNQILEDIILSANIIKTNKKQRQFRQSLMDAIYHSSSVFRMNTRFCSHGLSLFGELITIVIVVTIGYVIINYKSENFDLTPNQIILASTSLSLSSRLPTFIFQASNDFVFFTTFSNVSVKLLVDKIGLLVPKGVGEQTKMYKRRYRYTFPDNSIKIENITFRALGEKLNTLQDINLSIKKNSHVGLYTKDTGDLEALFYILSSLISPIKSSNGEVGRVLIGNIPITDFTPQEIVDNIMILNYNPVIFNGTLRENIDPYMEYTDEEINFALKEVQFWEELSLSKRIAEETMFGSLQFRIHFLGKDLPMGTTTKINIARAIVKKPSILLMYYSVKAAPIHLKDQLRQAIYRNLKGRCTILMATIDIVEMLKCDYIVGLNSGRVEEQGTPAELLGDEKSRLNRMVDYLIPEELIESRREIMGLRMAEVVERLLGKRTSFG